MGNLRRLRARPLHNGINLPRGCNNGRVSWAGIMSNLQTEMLSTLFENPPKRWLNGKMPGFAPFSFGGIGTPQTPLEGWMRVRQAGVRAAHPCAATNTDDSIGDPRECTEWARRPSR